MKTTRNKAAVAVRAGVLRLCGIAAVLAASSAFAVEPLGPAQLYTSAGAYDASAGAVDNQTDNGDASRTRSAYAATGGASASATAAPSPSVLLSASASSPLGYSTGHYAGSLATAELNYWFSVFGPDAELIVPVRFTASLWTVSDPAPSTGGDIYDPRGEAYAWLDVSGGLFFEASSCSRLDLCSYPDRPDGLTVAGLLNAPLGVWQPVTESASAGAAAGGSASAWADPYFFIDPDFLSDHPGYSLVFSDGIGNSLSAAPEPTAWAMMLLGFFTVGALIRRRRPAAV